MIKMTTDELAVFIYEAYVRAAGGKAFNGDDIPKWGQLREDRRKCWIAAAREIKDLFKEDKP